MLYNLIMYYNSKMVNTNQIISGWIKPHVEEKYSGYTRFKYNGLKCCAIQTRCNMIGANNSLITSNTFMLNSNQSILISHMDKIRECRLCITNTALTFYAIEFVNIDGVLFLAYSFVGGENDNTLYFYGINIDTLDMLVSEIPLDIPLKYEHMPQPYINFFHSINSKIAFSIGNIYHEIDTETSVNSRTVKSSSTISTISIPPDADTMEFPISYIVDENVSELISVKEFDDYEFSVNFANSHFVVKLDDPFINGQYNNGYCFLNADNHCIAIYNGNV